MGDAPVGLIVVGGKEPITGHGPQLVQPRVDHLPEPALIADLVQKGRAVHKDESLPAEVERHGVLELRALRDLGDRLSRALQVDIERVSD